MTHGDNQGDNDWKGGYGAYYENLLMMIYLHVWDLDRRDGTYQSSWLTRLTPRFLPH